MVAGQDGVVAFAGWVAGALFVSIDHTDGVRTTYSWVSAVSVKKGDKVARGSPIGNTGHGHPDVDQPHLHFGARIGNTYIDPLLLLEGADVSGLIHLAPLSGDWLAKEGWFRDAGHGGSSRPDRWSGPPVVANDRWIPVGQARSKPVVPRLSRGPPIGPIQWPSLADR